MPHAMVNVGRMNQLKVQRVVEFGLFLNGEERGEILLPVRYAPPNKNIGDVIDVFVCYDSDDRLIATTEKPKAMVGEFASLRVAATERIGTFLDWGIFKDLFMPFAEHTHRPLVGQQVMVYIYLDKSNRISASMKLDKHMKWIDGNFEEGQAVDLIIASKSELGFKAIINGQAWGLLYDNEIFQPLAHGQRIRGYIRKIRDDGKIDLSLQKTGNRAATEIGDRILDLLKEKGGFLDIHDKTPPEMIYSLFGISKKKYKIAVGGLYKKRLITIEDGGIRLLK